jgi:hypothetical protein
VVECKVLSANSVLPKKRRRELRYGEGPKEIKSKDLPAEKL